MTNNELKKRFVEFCGAREVRLFSAAGRVNLIGEHVDYCGGLVLPAALDLKCTIAARKNGSNKIRLAATTTPLTAELDINKLSKYKSLEWGSYQAGVAFVMQNAGFDIVGCDLLYDCSVPFGSGLSSSAAMEVATAFMLSAFSLEAGGKGADLKQIALLSQKAENEYCGVNCGIMDQFASSLGKEGNAMLLNCSTLDYEYVPLKLDDCTLVIANCNKPHSLVTSKYNERRAECESALEVLSEKLGVKCLAEISPEMFDGKAEKYLSGKIRDRASHVVHECARVKSAALALKSGDMATFGRLLDESHYSLRDLYEVTGKELDALSESARTSFGCLGSRMTGGGFGGCTVSLVKSDCVDEFIRETGAKYREAVGYDCTFYLTGVGNGAHEICE